MEFTLEKNMSLVAKLLGIGDISEEKNSLFSSAYQTLLFTK